MRKRMLALLLVLCLLPICGLAEVNNEYLAELQLLNGYVRTEGKNPPMSIEEICDLFDGNGRIGEFTVEFGIYANVLRLLEAGDYEGALSEASNLLNGSSFEAFRAYLEDGRELKSWGLYALDSVESLYNYAQGRALEASGEWKQAAQYYSTCEQFMDARERKLFANQVTPTPSPTPSPTPMYRSTPSPTLFGQGTTQSETDDTVVSVFQIQVGAYTKRENAYQQFITVQNKGFNAQIRKAGNLYKVQIVVYGTKIDAEFQLACAKTAGFEDAFISTDSSGTVIEVSIK